MTSEIRHTDPIARPKLVVKRFQLTVVAGPDKGKQLVSSDQLVRIGAHDSLELVLSDRKVSATHCEIQIADGRVVIRNFSRNGTTVDGVTVHEAELADGQVLGVGASKLKFEISTNRVAVAISERTRFGGLVGDSLAMRAVFAKLEKAAASTSTVLLTGESGTGKEGAAKALHEASGRAGAFVVVDCSALPPTLLESELFGYVRGAHSTATTDKEGAFELAAGGTIFLDEIGELPLELQPKLLRVLENRMVKRLGGKQHATLDLRFVAATNRDLPHEVNAKHFRQDLYYRLAVLEIRLPPLRERLGDLGMLVDTILANAGMQGRPEAATLRTPAVMDELARRRWSGNVRELRNYVERCLAFGTGAAADDVPPDAESAVRVDIGQPIRDAREQWLDVLERQYVDQILKLHDGNVTAAAKAAGLSRVQFHRLLWKHELR